MNTPHDQLPRPRPGRKRSDESRQAILAAALHLFAELGYAGVTIEGIAARSGTGKQTIYRWWPSKADVLLDALATTAELHVPVPDEGSYEADLRAFLTASFALGRKRPVTDVLRALMAEAQLNPHFHDRFWTGFLQRRRQALETVLDHARIRGDLPPHLAPDTIADIVFGVIWYRLLASRRAFDRRLVEQLVAALTGQAAPTSKRTRRT